MEAKEVRNLPWKGVEDWSALGKTYVVTNYWGITTDYIVSQTDGKEKIIYLHEDLKPILESENEPFYVAKARAYRSYSGLYPNGSFLRDLKKTLRIPDVSALNQTDSADKVGACVKQFEELSDLEKVIFLERIGKVSVKVETCAKGVPETTEN